MKNKEILKANNELLVAIAEHLGIDEEFVQSRTVNPSTPPPPTPPNG